MILDAKTLAPPPYAPRAASPAPTLPTLPPHLLLHIIHLTFPQSDLPDLPKLARQRKTLYWLAVSLRLVDRTLYAASMHVLRSTHIHPYDALVRPPYSSDPFPLLAPLHTPTTTPSPYASIANHSKSLASPLSTIQRETAVLDKFIALKVREDVWADDSELHLERDEAYKDLFDHAQPRARLEDLVREYGIQSGVICVAENDSVEVDNITPAPQQQQEPDRDTESKPRLFPPSTTYPTLPTHPSPSPSTTTLPTPSKPSFLSLFQRKPKPPPPPPSPSTTTPHPQIPTPIPIPMSDLTIALAPRTAGLVLSPSRRTIVSTPRTRDEPLESVARRLVRELQALV